MLVCNHFNVKFPISIAYYTLLLLLSFNYAVGYPKGCADPTTFDFIVIGSGSAGSVVASRLSENPKLRVLLLEAGGEPSTLSQIPLLAWKALNTRMDWNYTTESQEFCCEGFLNRRLGWFRGRALGGTGAINFMTYSKGNKHDYDHWADLGNEGWSYNDIKDYLLNMEDYQIPFDPKYAAYHHKGGPVTVSLPSYASPLAGAFLDAGKEMGYQVIDYNAMNSTGFMFPPAFLDKGKRVSSYTSYILPVLNRTNLVVLPEAFVTKIVIDESTKTATGVLYERENLKCSAEASKEVILSGGTINSPQILMVSGIGPRKTLEKFKIPVIVDIPGVGSNLVDHVTVGGLIYYVKRNASCSFYRLNTKENRDLWHYNGTGPLTVPNGWEGVAFIQQEDFDIPDYPNIEIFMDSDSTVRFLRQFIAWDLHIYLTTNRHEAVSFQPIVLRPKSKGYVTIASADPHVAPLMDPRYLSDPDDLDQLIRATRFVYKLVTTPAFSNYTTGSHYLQLLPRCILHYLNRDAYDRCYVRTMTTTAYHPSGTCKMTPASDEMGVVDCRLRVRGVKGLRVVDASIMPRSISAHIAVGVMMIGEKAATMIKEDMESGPVACKNG